MRCVLAGAMAAALLAAAPARAQQDPWSDVRALEGAQQRTVPDGAPAKPLPPKKSKPAEVAPPAETTQAVPLPPARPSQVPPRLAAASPVAMPAAAPIAARSAAPAVEPAIARPLPRPASAPGAVPAPVQVAAAAPAVAAPVAAPTERAESADGWGLLATPLSTLFPPALASEAASEESPSHESPSHEGSAEPPGTPQEPGHAEGATPAKAADSTDIPVQPAPPLYREVRELQRLQDRMATGSGEALDAQNALIASIDKEFRAADSLAWRDPLNARALVIFALSGGGPATLRAVLAGGASPDIDERLLRGSLAYLEGREADALKELSEIDARALPASLAGQVALAQAALWVRRDPARAAALLGYARLIAPGTLVEEAALRREIFIAAQANDLAGFERLSAAYLARFRHSVYAGNFRQRFAAALTRMDFLNDANEFHRLDDLLAPIEPEGRREIALMVAQAAVAQGRTTAATMAAARVLAAAPPGSLDADRARLYRAAAMAASADRYDVAEAELAAIARERLPAADARLLDAARSVAGAVQHASDDAPPPASTAKAESSASPAGDAGADEPPPVLAKAQAALRLADERLAGRPL